MEKENKKIQEIDANEGEYKDFSDERDISFDELENAPDDLGELFEEPPLLDLDFDEEPSGGDEGAIQATLMEAERLKLMILNNYVKYLGNTYGELSMKKIQIVTTQLRMKLFDNINRRNNSYINELYYLEEDEPKRGRGRYCIILLELKELE